MTEEEQQGPLEREAIQRGVVRGALWTMIHTFIAIPVAFAVNLLIARVLGAADYGRLAFLTALMEVVSGILAGGFGTAVIQYGARDHAAGRTEAVASLLSRAQGFRLLVAMPVLTAVVILVADVPPSAVAIAVVFGIVLPAFLDGSVACLTIENKTDSGAKIALVIALVTQAAVTVVLLLSHSADAVWATRLVVTGLGIALCLIPISKAYRKAVLRPWFPRGFVRGFWRFAIVVGLAGIVGQLVMSRSEIFLMNWLATPAALGVFALAFGLANHVFAPAQAFIGPLVPAIAGLREVDIASVPAAFRRVLRAGAFAVGLIDAAAIVPLAILVPVLYGHEFTQAAPVFVVLALAGGLSVVAGPVTAFVSARLSAGELLRANSIALVVDVVLAVALIPLLGVWGAVIANASGALTSLLLLTRWELDVLGIRWSSALRDSSSLWLASGIAVVLALTVPHAPGSPWVHAVAAGLIGAGAYLLGLRFLRIGLTDADAGAILRSLPGPLRKGASPLLNAVRHTAPTKG